VVGAALALVAACGRGRRDGHQPVGVASTGDVAPEGRRSRGM